eukprot:SAG11_NODE_26831_length_340_cov_0.850622_1_plen_58_part_10
MTCPVGSGSGDVVSLTGLLPNARSIDVVVPPGVESGQRFEVEVTPESEEEGGLDAEAG